MNPTILGGVIGPGFLIRFLHYISLRPRQLSNLREDKGASIIIRIGFLGVTYYSCSEIRTPSPILIMKAPTLGALAIEIRFPYRF